MIKKSKSIAVLLCKFPKSRFSWNEVSLKDIARSVFTISCEGGRNRIACNAKVRNIILKQWGVSFSDLFVEVLHLRTIIFLKKK